MAEISKLKLPNGEVYDLKVSVEHISGQLPISKGGTGASGASEARQNLGLGAAATYNTTSVINDTTDLPTSTAVKTRISNYIIVSENEPIGQITGDIWAVTAESIPFYDNGDSASYGST